MANWSIPLDQLAVKANTDLSTLVRKVTLDVYRAVVLKSPVDTGRFRANWNVSYGQPDYSTTDSVDQSRGDQQVSLSASLPTGGVTYLSNGLPYAQKLESGSSKQAPTGMVATTVVEFTDFVREALAKG